MIVELHLRNNFDIILQDHINQRLLELLWTVYSEGKLQGILISLLIRISQ
jgi:hypothetical protein